MRYVKDVLVRSRLADNAHGFVGADLMAVVKEAGMNVLRKNSQNMKTDNDEQGEQVLVIGEDDLRQAFQHVRPSGLREIAIDVPKVKPSYLKTFFILWTHLEW